MNPAAALSAVVVEPTVPNGRGAAQVLASAGFQVVTASSFETARQRIVSSRPAVLVTPLKLGEYNGLHLVLRARTANPRLAALVTIDDRDASFKKDVQQMGATFVANPITPRELLAAVLRTLFRTDPTTIIEPPFERRLSERRKATSEFVPDRRGHERRRNVDAVIHTASLG